MPAKVQSANEERSPKGFSLLIGRQWTV
jgi:hypothetical protein